MTNIKCIIKGSFEPWFIDLKFISFFFLTLVHFFSKDILLKSNIREYYLIKMFWNLCREKFPVAVFAAVFCKVFWHLTRIPLRRTSPAFSWSGVKFWIHNNYHFHEIWIWWTHYQVSGGILSVSIVVNNILAYLYISLTLANLKDDANITFDLTNAFQKYWKREKVGHASYISSLILLLCESGSEKMFHVS